MSSEGLAPARMEDLNIYDKMGMGCLIGTVVGCPLTLIVFGIMAAVADVGVMGDRALSCLACVPACAIIGAVTPLIIGVVRKHLDENRDKALEQNLEEL